jgi:hypothetical protein
LYDVRAIVVIKFRFEEGMETGKSVAQPSEHRETEAMKKNQALFGGDQIGRICATWRGPKGP